jgi:hypothetical protein
MKRAILSIAALLFLISAMALSAAAQEIERGVMVREAPVYLAPATDSQKLDTVPRGREVAVLERSRDFIKVLANVDRERSISGWILDKGVVRKDTPNGDQILFGEAADSEAEASRRGGRRGAAQDAMRLYYHTYEYFPKSPLAGEALWRAADIQWQIDRADARSRPSAKEMDPYLHSQIDEDMVKEVEKKFPHTKWADLAAFDRLDNKLCGDWRGLPKCPEKETDLYLDYVKDHPQSPKAAEALYEAAWRQAALVDIYRANNDSGKSNEARNRAIQLAQRIIAEHPEDHDWPYRAQRLLYLLQQGISLYGNPQS